MLVLGVICILLLTVRLTLSHWITPEVIVIKNLPLIERKSDSLTKSNRHNSDFYDAPAKLKLFAFDPNTASYEELIKLGFKEKTAKTFLKFRGKRFAFKQKEDVKKVYGISESFYAKLEPYIIISAPEIQKAEEKAPAKHVEAAKKIVELNSTDSLALLDLKGIGPAFAKRILKYRSLLGGYTSVLQLKEVYGFTDELFEKVKPVVNVNPSLIKKLNINKDDFKTVNKHPYLSYELTKEIFNAKRKAPLTQQGLKDILNDEALFNKLLPYLEFD